MSAEDYLDDVSARYREWHEDRGDHTPAPNTENWSKADHPDESMEHCIVRNDVPALVAGLHAVLQKCNQLEALVKRRGDYTDYDMVTAFTAGEIRKAIGAALGVES